MVEYIIGNYLVESGKITLEQMRKTMQEQDDVRVKLGLIAVAKGMLTMDQADEINRLQAVLDQRFGDIAVTKGYLTEEHINKLLKEQGSSYLTFIQALVDRELVSLDEVDWLLNDFRQTNGYSNSELEDIKSDDVDRIVPLLLPEEGKLFTEIICTTVRTLIRLIDRHVYVGRAAMVDSFPTEEKVSQAMVGKNGILDCFSERDGALLRTCSVFGQEEFGRLDLDSLDAAGELLNCINGLYVAGLSRQGRFLELMPPEYGGDREEIKKGSICRIPIFVENHGLYFTVAELE